MVATDGPMVSRGDMSGAETSGPLTGRPLRAGSRRAHHRLFSAHAYGTIAPQTLMRGWPMQYTRLVLRLLPRGWSRGVLVSGPVAGRVRGALVDPTTWALA